MKDAGQSLYEFGPFRLDPAERLLLRDGSPVPLTPKSFDLLVLLVRNSGRMLGKEDLLGGVWPDTFVEEGTLARNISTLRKALGEPEGGARYIETVPKRGYRFAAAVTESGGAADAAARSIAVLPFQLLGAESGDEYLGLGIADALITKLGRIRRLAVRPTSAVSRYAGGGVDAVAAGRELRVEAVVEGRVRRVGGRARATVQLVGVREGSTLWSETFDEKFADLFDLEDAVSEHVARALVPQLSEEERGRLAERHTASPEARRLYLKGRYFWNKRTAEALDKGIEYFRRAVELDPEFALAYSGLADSYLFGASTQPPREVMPQARAAAARALELDDTLAEAHTSLARISMSFDWDWAAAGRSFRRAIELNPNYATARQWHANYLLATGRASEAVSEIRRAQELDPLSLAVNSAAGWVFYMSRRFAEAAEQYEKALEMDAHFAQARRELAMVYEQLGRYEEAAAAAREAARLSCENPVALGILAHIQAAAGRGREARKSLPKLERLAAKSGVLQQILAAIHLALGERGRAVEYLRRAYESRAPSLVWLGVDPWFDPMRTDAAFRELARRIGLKA